MEHLTTGELIAKLREFPPDTKILFYDVQYEHAHWGITDVEVNEHGTVIMSDQDYGV